MFASLRPVVAAAVAVTFALAPAARAQETAADQGTAAQQEHPAADPNRVLATVNGTEIKLANVIAVRAGLPRQYDRFPAKVLFSGILDQLIQQTLLMQSFEGELSLGGKVQIENDRRAVRANEAISALLAGKITDAALRKLYDEKYPADAQKKEYKAAHILVKTEKEAQELVAQLADGADFAALAKKKSIGPSASAGGDLGWFSDGDMVPPFFEAVAALSPGEISAPVKTEFGWHVIKLEQIRDKARPEFETVRGDLENTLRQKLLDERVGKLSEKAEIVRADTTDLDPAAINDLQLLGK